jgi:hypothetical protein
LAATTSPTGSPKRSAAALGLDAIPWTPALAVKLAFGAALAALITPIALRAALASR